MTVRITIDGDTRPWCLTCQNTGWQVTGFEEQAIDIGDGRPGGYTAMAPTRAVHCPDCEEGRERAARQAEEEALMEAAAAEHEAMELARIDCGGGF